ncbi:glutamine amidotransferase domain [Streptomyces phage TurkishDelight]|uniref:asparagine synthase (glutamine-hydrolyzing) n=1 Tax=Streptomyces phage TurkishDelight TaxID=2793708 RepID=A0A7T0Q3R0_9CAUD|nr:glutamine amidotransferase domain [Streptomyces phage TurkishDelight]QPL14153.1 glutamine amidotransferase domain [Streptomyces phage TurkishDelight]
MCGIIAAAGVLELAPAVDALAHRGPDASAIVQEGGVTLGHTRLAIQDPAARSDQPYQDGPVTLVYNGELFNAPRVRALVETADPRRTWSTTGDTEVVAAALAVLGPETTLPELDGMYGLAWTDTRRPGVLMAARDRHGEVPLHVHRGAPLLVASELKAFRALGRRCGKAVVDVPPGEWWELYAGAIARHTYHQLTVRPRPTDPDQATADLAHALSRAVDRRVISDVPVCALLSGGVDSAAITLELTRHHPDLTCYTARLDPRSRDLRCARETADMLGVRLVEVDIPPPTADDLATVIHHIEQPYKAQVEIGWACLQLAAAIRSDGFKVTYTGEGSDELWASYGFAYHGLATSGWYAYRRDLIAAQAVKNFPRVNKAFLVHGVEGRLPFLDPDVVSLALSMPREAVQDGPSRPKAVLQRAYRGRLPDTVTSRAKVAFQDGLGLKAAIASALPNPARFYRAEHTRLYG